MRHWLIIVSNRTALEWILDTRRMAFRSHVNTDQLQKGDRFALYTSRGAYGNTSRDESQIIALGRLTSPVTEASVRVGDEAFTKSCAISVERALPLRAGLPFRTLVGQLSIAKTARQWPASVRRTVATLDDNDFRVIEAAFSALAE